MNWLYINILTAFIPIIIRLSIYLLSGNLNIVTIFNPFDYVIIGIVLGVNNVNELNHFPDDARDKIVTFLRLSWVVIIIASLFFGYLTFIYEFENPALISDRLKYMIMILAISSISISYLIMLEQKILVSK